MMRANLFWQRTARPQTTGNKSRASAELQFGIWQSSTTNSLSIILVMGNTRQLPRHCLHLFVPAKRNTIDGHGKNDLHTRCMACGEDRIDFHGTKKHGPTVTTNIVTKKEAIRNF